MTDSKSDAQVLYLGLEGGASNTTLIAIKEDGTELARASGSGTNAWLEGMEAVAATIRKLLTQIETSAGLPDTTRYVSFGLCMSGFAQQSQRDKLIALLKESGKFDHIEIMNDSVGSAYLASPNGGFVIISGTGSIAQVINNEGDYRSGGWGHLFGDEGSAYYIAAKGVRLLARAMDGYAIDVPDITVAKRVIFDYFNATSLDDLVEYFYSKFEKSHAAGVTRHLADAARTGDAFCASLFVRAGRHLGRMIRSLGPKAPARADGVVPILAVGSVWKSIDLLLPGIQEGISSPKPGLYGQEDPARVVTFSFELRAPTNSSAFGAAAVAAKSCSRSIPLNYDSLSTAIHSYRHTA